MHEDNCNSISQEKDIYSLVQLCLKTEHDSGLAENSLKEIKRYLNEFTYHCKSRNVHSVKELTPEFLKCYADQRCDGAGPNLKKAVVWSLRKFGRHLAMRQVLKEDPARHLRHPKFHPRSELPDYLSETQLRILMEHAAKGLPKMDFAMLSLLTTAGLRPYEITAIKQRDVYLEERFINLHVKGGWIKKTPLSQPMAFVLGDYLKTHNDDYDALFVNTRGHPVSVSFVQRMVKQAGKEAGLSLSLTCNHLRHTFGTHLADQNGKVITKALMGHQRLATTEIYTHLSPRYFKSLMNLHPYQRVIEKGAINGQS